MSKRRERGREGASSIEFALLLPWVIFLFVGAFDWGFYAHALISTENATRVAAIYAANLGGGSISKATACGLVLNELSVSANVAGQTTCVWGTSVTDSAPVGVTETCTTVDSVSSVQVAVTYRTLQLIPIPGILTGKTTLYRTATLPMNLYDNGGSCPTPS
jgi:Flp pilus assembly protein TadG